MENSNDQQQQAEQIDQQLQNQQQQQQDDQNFHHLRFIDNIIPHKSSSSEEEEVVQKTSSQIKFLGEEILKDRSFQYEPDEVPLRSILKSNDSKDFKNLRDIDGKPIRHETQDEERLLQGSQLQPQEEQLRIDSVQERESIEETRQQDPDNAQRSTTHIKIKEQAQMIDDQESPRFMWRASSSVRRDGILKNSQPKQGSEYKNLKKIEVVQNKKRFLEENLDYEGGNIHFAGEVVLEPSYSYQFQYDPQEQPERSILKGINKSGSRRKSYQFDKLKNIEGKVLTAKFQDEDQNMECSNEASCASKKTNDKSGDVYFGGEEILQEKHDYHSDWAPNKPIIKRRQSLDMKKLRKEKIDGKYLKKKIIHDDKNVHFGAVIALDQIDQTLYKQKPFSSKEHSQKSILKKAPSQQDLNPNQILEKFEKKWEQLRKDYQRDAIILLESLTPLEMQEAFQSGISEKLLEQILEVLKQESYEPERLEFVKEYLESICQIEGFEDSLSDNGRNDIIVALRNLRLKKVIAEDFYEKITRKI